MWVILRPRVVSEQRMLWCPRGQVTTCFSQSTRKLTTSKPSLACQVLS